MKKIFLILSIFLIVNLPTRSELIIQSDTIKIDTLKKTIDPKKLTDIERKNLEYIEWQKKSNIYQRSQQIDKNIEVIDKQNASLDSLLIKK
jgi:hypothetical protein